MASEFKTVSGLSRKPSVLLAPVPEARSRSPCAPRAHKAWSSAEGQEEGRAILEWEEDDVAAWLAELGFQEYQVAIKKGVGRIGRPWEYGAMPVIFISSSQKVAFTYTPV